MRKKLTGGQTFLLLVFVLGLFYLVCTFFSWIFLWALSSMVTIPPEVNVWAVGLCVAIVILILRR